MEALAVGGASSLSTEKPHCLFFVTEAHFVKMEEFLFCSLLRFGGDILHHFLLVNCGVPVCQHPRLAARHKAACLLSHTCRCHTHF